jgi:acetyl-CoA carboxylase biotin carboxyl carrier protein
MTTGSEKPAAGGGEELQRLNELLEVMHEHDLDALTLKAGETTYELVRRERGATIDADAFAVLERPAPGSGAAPGSGSGSSHAAAPSPRVKRVIAPLTGVFYNAASPDSEPFVKVGDRVETGAILCILEAMKLFNEIQSDYAGTIARVVPQNGELVSQGEELFWIEP